MRDPISSANWTFTMHEVSAGVYRITGKHRVGATIELTGTDPDQLSRDAKDAAEELDRRITEKTNP